MGETPAFHRTGQSNPLGKSTAEIGKFKLPEETKELLEREAREAGMTLTEFCKLTLMIRAHGEERVRSLYLARFEVVAGKGRE